MSFFPQPKPRPRLLEREDERSADERLARQIRMQVRQLDGWRCRVCGRTVYMDAAPARRAETHHIVPRSLAPERVNDPENLLTVCGKHHAQLTAHELQIVGTDRETARIERGPNFRPGR